MKAVQVSVLLSLAAGTASLAHAQGKSPRAPAIPRGVQESERAALIQCEAALGQGKFDLVTSRLAPLLPAAVIPVFVDWAPVPVANRPAARLAAASAIKAWHAGPAGNPRCV